MTIAIRFAAAFALAFVAGGAIQQWIMAIYDSAPALDALPPLAICILLITAVFGLVVWWRPLVIGRTASVMLVAMLVFGVAGSLLKKTNHPLAPMVLAIVLGDKAEEAFRQSLLASQGGLGVFFSTKLVSSIMMLGLIALFWPLIQEFWSRLRTPSAAV